MQIAKEILPTGMVTLFKRDKTKWSKVVDGTTSATEWKGLHEVSETVHLYNPSNGWLQNCNSISVAGPESPKEENYLPYT
jgi:acyl-homoserine lactone acylase PvdQ